MKKLLLAAGILLVLLTPILWWQWQPSQELQTLIVDKTVPNETYREHKGLMWIMNHKKYVNGEGNPYTLHEDYTGYNPVTGDTTSLPQDLSSFEFFYIADTYGIDAEGGLSLEEAERITGTLSEKPRPFVAEFNSFSSPTSEEARTLMTDMLDIQVTGWRGRYFSSLADTSDAEIPDWAVQSYEQQSSEDWSFEGAGYLFVHEDGRINVLEADSDLSEESLTLTFSEAGKSRFGLTDSPPYPYWFDVIEANREDAVMAAYELDVTEKGKAKLQEAGIPASFPAITRTVKDGAPFYYFAGDYADMDNLPGFKRMQGLPTLMKWFSFGDNSDPSPFYWKTYVPMMQKILEEAREFSPKQTASATKETKVSPARIKSNEFEVYKNGEWTTEVIKGVNMGMAKPGTFPGEAAITEQEYARWFRQISDMNANALRVYTRHPPEFYKALKRHNEEVEEPLYVLHGVWAEEEPLEETLDSFNEESTTKFREEIKNLIDVIHGNADIPDQPGHASGTYTADISDYVAGWIIGVEWYPEMVRGTNKKHQGIGEYDGQYLFTDGASPFEHWLTSMMDFTIEYEKGTYNVERPISFTNWVTTDLLDHPSEPLPQEDLASVNPNVVQAKETFTSGMFASYHVYPYYPDFLNYDEEYLAYTDHRGEKNSYAGYLNDLISQHEMPVLIAEFGVPGSRGKTHENPFGLDQGHHSEKEQGEINKRLFEDIIAEGAMGGLVFTWQDEWFKRTWNTMDLDDPDRRPFWSNAQTNEQQFGLLAFDRLKRTIDGKGESWEDKELERKESGPLRSLAADHDERYLYLRLETEKSFSFEEQSLTVAFDTIRDQGITDVSGVPFGEGIDFRLDINSKDDASLKVDSYYDPFYYQYGHVLGSIEKKAYAENKDNGTFHPIRLALNKELTLPESGEVVPFTSYETGKLTHGDADPESEDYNSLTDFSIGPGIIEIRLPWLLLNVKDPSTKQQMTDLYAGGLEASEEFESFRFAAYTQEKEERVSDILPAQPNDVVETFMNYSWEKWDIPEHEERLKNSYDIMQETFKNH